jgi:hypothetical protein
MKHSPADFAAHFLGLLKNSGNTGNSGNSEVNAFNQKDKTVSSDVKKMLPVDRDWQHGINVTGNKNTMKINYLPSLLPVLPVFPLFYSKVQMNRNQGVALQNGMQF